MGNRSNMRTLVGTLALGLVFVWGVLASSSRAQTDDRGVPPPPDEPAAAKAYAAFDQFCARCHQRGKLKGLRAANGFANILDLQAIAANPALVQPGNPDASRIYTMMLSRAMPYDVAHDAKGAEPTATELTAVRDWLQSLPPPPQCPQKRALSSKDELALIEKAVAEAGAEAANLRFVTLRHLATACAPVGELAAYGEAVTRLVNSLSFGLEPVSLTANETGIFQINLARIGWDRQRWERLVAGYPYASGRDVPGPLGETLKTKIPVVRGDWFVTAATQAPLYYELLGLPDRLQSLQSSLQIDVIGDMSSARARRVGTRSSPFARGSRLLQRHPFANGAYWTTFDYAPTPGRADLFDAPAGPGARGAQKADANFVMFSLPNGYNAFYIANTDGIRVNALPQSVVRNEAKPGQPIGAALACFSCHENGPRGAEDELRPRLQADTALSREGRDRLLAMHAAPDELQRLIGEDAKRLQKALELSSVDPTKRVNGLQPLESLVQRYQRKMSLDEAASELDATSEALLALAEKDRLAPADRAVVERLRFGLVARAEFESHFAALTAGLGGQKAAASAAVPLIAPSPAVDIASELDLVIRADKEIFKPGELLTIRARAATTCYLTLVSIDRNGRGTVVFPNDFEQNNLVEAGREIQVPSQNAPYQFRLRDKGRETIVGVCAPSQKAADGIKHDFERQRFTELGDYRSFLARTWATETEERKGLVQSKDARNRRAKRLPGSGELSAARYEPQARTAIQIEIK